VPLPESAARSIDQAEDEVRDVYRITMANGATAEHWTVLGYWDGDVEWSFAGDWSPFGMTVHPEHGFLEGRGSEWVTDCMELWASQDRGRGCDTCRCSGRVCVNIESRLRDVEAGLPWGPDEWETCPECLGTAWIPNPPEDLQ
jgi:hypothetical protein